MTPKLRKVPVDSWNDAKPGLTKYEVLDEDAGDRKIGIVYSVFEWVSGPKVGRNVVAWRRLAKTPSWRAETARDPGRASKFTSRQSAIAWLVKKAVDEPEDAS